MEGGREGRESWVFRTKCPVDCRKAKSKPVCGSDGHLYANRSKTNLPYSQRIGSTQAIKCLKSIQRENTSKWKL